MPLIPYVYPAPNVFENLAELNITISFNGLEAVSLATAPATTSGIRTKSKSKESCGKVRKLETVLEKQAKITTKGQITVPIAVRRVLGVGPGDALLFETDKAGVRVRPVRTKSRFAKYRGIGNRGIRSGKKAINRWIREMRGR